MNSWEIVKYVEYFNIAAVCFFAFLAICGVLLFVCKKAGLKNFSQAGIFIMAFCVAPIIAFALEATVFNLQYYLRFFSGSELYTTEVSPENPAVILTSDGTLAELSYGRHDTLPAISITFKDLDRKVTSVFVDAAFKDNDTIRILVKWMDEGKSIGYYKTLYRGLSHENYAPIQPYGKVSELTVYLLQDPKKLPVGFVSVAINKPIPFYFSGVRLGVVSLLLFVLFIFVRKDLRARVSYYLFEYRFNPKSKKQNIAFVLLVFMLILFSWVNVYTTPATFRFIKGPVSEQYNVHLVDALMNGRLWLDFGEPERLSGAELPYSSKYLTNNGYRQYVDWVADWVWYKGKFYSYYGIAPVALFFVPYKMVTGGYLSLYAAVFLFVSVAVCFLAALWRFCVKKYMPDARFVFYLLSFAALFFCILQFYILRYPTVYSAAQSAGLMFVAAGIFLLLKSIEYGKIGYVKLFFACLCFALAVGSRPNLVLASLFVPIILWKYRSWKLLAFIAIPYVMVAIPLCAYNYARFGSILEFGTSYVIGVGNVPFSNPIAKVNGIFTTITYYLFLPNYYKLYFPFVEYYPAAGHTLYGAFQYRQLGSGLINFPILFCLFYLFKKDFRLCTPEPFRLSAAFIIVGAVILLGTSCIAPWFHGRYMVDFIVFIVLPSLFCAYFWCNSQNSVHQPRTRLKVTYVLLIASIFVGLFLYVLGDEYSPKDPALYRYLERSLGIFRDI